MNIFLGFIFSLLLPAMLAASAPAIKYRLCIDGGGSKTMMQVLNSAGGIVLLKKDRQVHDRIIVGGSNINNIGFDALRDVLALLVDDVELHDGEAQIALKSILSECSVIAGMSGMATAENQASARTIFASLGVLPAHITVMGDADMALEYVGEGGIILIAGTGSICLGKGPDGRRKRVGGLGRVLGDEGSAYRVGLAAMKAALADEYGWGPSTALTTALRSHFCCTELKTLAPGINAGITPSGTLAGLAPIVFAEARDGDSVAQRIVQKAKAKLIGLVHSMLYEMLTPSAPLHCWGGLFKGSFASDIITGIQECAERREFTLEITNHAHDNLPVLFALKNS